MSTPSTNTPDNTDDSELDTANISDPPSDDSATAPPYPQPLGALDFDRASDITPDAFFTGPQGAPTIVTGADLLAAIPEDKRDSLTEVERYWAVYPYSFISICRDETNNEYRYYVVEPAISELEQHLLAFVADQLRSNFRHDDESILSDDSQKRRKTVREKSLELLADYNLYTGDAVPTAHEQSHIATAEGGEGGSAAEDDSAGSGGFFSRLGNLFSRESSDAAHVYDEDYDGPNATNYGAQEGMDYLSPHAKPEGHPAYWEDSADGDRVTADGLGEIPDEYQVTMDDDSKTLNDYQAFRLLYYLEREFVGYKRIDAIKNDINVEDISVNGYNEPVFVYHTQYEQVLTNVEHGKGELDSFVTSLAQFSGKELSSRDPQADATLPDGSRGQLTLGTEVSDKGTNYTLRQFKDIPFTPVDLINWNTYSIDQLALMWLAVEHNQSLLIAGGTASGKTTTLNALSLFIPPTDKIVTIEDTRELELPQRNWIASMTREGAGGAADASEIDEYALLESALRQRPDYILMGEIRGEEGRTLFQVMSSGHTSYSTFHSNSVDEVVKRFTTPPIDVQRTQFIALDFIAVQDQIYVDDQKERRAQTITEVRDYDPDNEELTITDIYSYNAATDSHEQTAQPESLTDIANKKGWTQAETQAELYRRKTVLSYLVTNGLNTYDEVAAVLQSYMIDSNAILSMIAQDSLEDIIPQLKEIGNVDIRSDPAAEESIPRPTPDEETEAAAKQILSEASDLLESAADEAGSLDSSEDIAEQLDFEEDLVPEDVGKENDDEEVADEADTDADADAPSPDEDVEEIDLNMDLGNEDSRPPTSAPSATGTTDPDAQSEAPPTRGRDDGTHASPSHPPTANTQPNQPETGEPSDPPTTEASEPDLSFQQDRPTTSDSPPNDEPQSPSVGDPRVSPSMDNDDTVDAASADSDSDSEPGTWAAMIFDEYGIDHIDDIDSLDWTTLQQLASDLDVAVSQGSRDDYEIAVRAAYKGAQSSGAIGPDHSVPHRTTATSTSEAQATDQSAPASEQSHPEPSVTMSHSQGDEQGETDSKTSPFEQEDPDGDSPRPAFRKVVPEGEETSQREVSVAETVEGHTISIDRAHIYEVSANGDGKMPPESVDAAQTAQAAQTAPESDSDQGDQPTQGTSAQAQRSADGPTADPQPASMAATGDGDRESPEPQPDALELAAPDADDSTNTTDSEDDDDGDDDDDDDDSLFSFIRPTKINPELFK